MDLTPTKFYAACSYTSSQQSQQKCLMNEGSIPMIPMMPMKNTFPHANSFDNDFTLISKANGSLSETPQCRHPILKVEKKITSLSLEEQMPGNQIQPPTSQEVQLEHDLLRLIHNSDNYDTTMNTHSAACSTATPRKIYPSITTNGVGSDSIDNMDATICQQGSQVASTVASKPEVDFSIGWINDIPWGMRGDFPQFEQGELPEAFHKSDMYHIMKHVANLYKQKGLDPNAMKDFFKAQSYQYRQNFESEEESTRVYCSSDFTKNSFQ
eukprot:gene4951-6919_t